MRKNLTVSLDKDFITRMDSERQGVPRGTWLEAGRPAKDVQITEPGTSGLKQYEKADEPQRTEQPPPKPPEPPELSLPTSKSFGLIRKLPGPGAWAND